MDHENTRREPQIPSGEVLIDGDVPSRQRFSKGFLPVEDEENSVEVLTNPLARSTQRLSELKAKGVELHEILGGQVGAAFIRDYCDGDHEVAYAAFALVYSPTSAKREVEEKGEGGAFPEARASGTRSKSRGS
jgi:hypothetical protein